MREAARYIDNAKELLKKSPIEDGRYADDKYVKSACGVAYLGVLRAIDQFLMRKGHPRKELPKSRRDGFPKVEEYEKALRRYASSFDGKLLKAFRDIYDELHIGGYYRGNLHRVDVVNAALKGAEEFISKLSP